MDFRSTTIALRYATWRAPSPTRRLLPHALEWDEKKHFPVDVIRETAPLGMGAIYVREDVGGSALSRFDAALIFEALATGCPADFRLYLHS